MLCCNLRVLALTVVTAASAATPADACCLFGGGWGCWRPLSRASYFGPRMAYYGGYSSGYWGSSGCCDSGCSSCGVGGCSSCGVSGCNSCSSGYCGTQSYYGPACNTCGTGCSDGCCSSGWCASGTCGTSSNCCTPYTGSTSEPIADPNRSTAPANDSFRSAPSGSGSSIPNSSIPNSSIPNSSIPNTNPSTGDYGSGRNLNDPNSNYLNGTGGDAPIFQPPRQPEAGEPNMIKIDPLDVDRPLVQSFRPARARVQVWSEAPLPQIAARTLPTIQELAATQTPAVVASR